jgi:hypothetical protein
MNEGLVNYLPIILLSALFIIFLWRRHSLGKFDWATFFAIILSLLLLANVIILILDRRSETTMGIQILLIIIPVIILAMFLLFVLRVLTVEKLKSHFRIDERLTTINVKSARNALAAVYLNLIIDLIIYSNLSNGLLVGILVASLVVYIASMIIYYYRSF